jgi:FkbM family methyltransferase
MPTAAYPEVFKSIPFERGRIEGDVIRTRVGSTQRRAYDAGIAQDQQLSEQFLFDFYCAETILTDNSGVFEWLDICESVQRAKGTYTFVELGAGYARWTVLAHFIAARFFGLTTRLICVEPEPTHYQWAVENFLANGLRPRDHVLLEGAVAGDDGHVFFQVGDPAVWYGQSIVAEVRPGLRERVLAKCRSLWPKKGPVDAAGERGKKCVKAYSLRSLLEPARYADIIHMDIQGSEHEVLAGAIRVINEKVKRLHIGTHGPAIEAHLHALLGENGWTCLRNYPGQGRHATEFGEMDFEDGIQTWVNPRLSEEVFR